MYADIMFSYMIQFHGNEIQHLYFQKALTQKTERVRDLLAVEKWPSELIKIF